MIIPLQSCIQICMQAPTFTYYVYFTDTMFQSVILNTDHAYLYQFYQSLLMFGFCQNVEIIHQHHHHFYPSTPSLPNRPNESQSRLANGASSHPEGTISANRSPPLQESYSSKFYRSKRAYLHRTQRGIQVVCKNQGKIGESHRKSLEDLTTLPIRYQQMKSERPNYTTSYQNHHSGPYLPFCRPIKQFPANTISYNRHCQQNLHSIKLIPQEKQTKLEMSTPTININLASRNSSSTTKKHQAVNAHQLKQSVIGFPEANVYETRKIHHEVQANKNYKISICIPLDHHNKLSPHRGAQMCRQFCHEKDSILTKKNQTHFLKLFKTERLFDDVKSIVSRESEEMQCMNIEESMIISRSMDYFCHLTPETSFDQYRLFLAKDKYINQVVSIKVFQNKHEQRSFYETNIYNKLAEITEKQHIEFGVLDLYKVLIEGVPPYKNIIFVLQPYENLLQQILIKNKQYFLSNHSFFFNFLRDLQEQISSTLMIFNQFRLVLTKAIDAKDIVKVNGKYKFHSVLKFGLQNQSAPQEYISNIVVAFIKSIQASMRYHN